MALNPALHALVHAETTACGHDHRDESAPADSSADSHVCAITLFGQGLTLLAPVAIQPTAEAVWGEISFAAVKEPLLSAPRPLHAPPCGPPLV